MKSENYLEAIDKIKEKETKNGNFLLNKLAFLEALRNMLINDPEINYEQNMLIDNKIIDTEVDMLYDFKEKEIWNTETSKQTLKNKSNYL